MVARPRRAIVCVHLHLEFLIPSWRRGRDVGLARQKQRKAQGRRKPAADNRAYVNVPARSHFHIQWGNLRNYMHDRGCYRIDTHQAPAGQVASPS